jgi:EAL domain-containing protein (putative c-di-GMP-specific phosphodiesterase class I)
LCLLGVLFLTTVDLLGNGLLGPWLDPPLDVSPSNAHTVLAWAELMALVTLVLLELRGGGLHRGVSADLVLLQQHNELEYELARSRAVQRARIENVLETSSLPEMVFQPIVSLASGVVVGHEALARFPLGSPEGWFDEAAEVGLLAELELKAIRLGLRSGAVLAADAGTYVSVNCSPVTLLHPMLLEVLANRPVADVVLELTEHLPVSDYVRHKEALDAVRRLGVRLAIDDAGAGYSSLQHILRLEPELIKIDRCFIADVDSDLGKQKIVASLLALGNAIGAKVIAEGVEAPAESAALERLGVPFCQGWLFGPAEALPAVGRRRLVVAPSPLSA